MHADRLLEMEMTLSVINVGILANVLEGVRHQTTGYRVCRDSSNMANKQSLYRISVSTYVLCTRIIWHLTRLILNFLKQNMSSRTLIRKSSQTSQSRHLKQNWNMFTDCSIYSLLL